MIAMSSALAADVLSYIALACMTFMLLPQAYLHVKQQSTRGLSSLMLIAFLVASLMSGTYDYLSHQPPAITLAWAGFSTLALVCLCQVNYYDEANMANQTVNERRIRFVLSLLFSSFLCCVACVGVYFLLLASIAARVSWLPNAFGYIVPVALNVGAYCVQFQLIISSKDASGLSLGFMGFDTSAGVVSIAAIALDSWDGAAAAPYFVIIGCQLIMAVLYFVVYPASPVNNKSIKQPRKSIKLSQVELADVSDMHSVVTDSPDSRSEHDSDFTLDSDASDFELNSDDEHEVRIDTEHHYNAGYMIDQAITRSVLHSMNLASHWIAEPQVVQPIR